jgi:hypothetical protein
MPTEYTQRRVKCMHRCGYNLRDTSTNRSRIASHERRCYKRPTAAQFCSYIRPATSTSPNVTPPTEQTRTVLDVPLFCLPHRRTAVLDMGDNGR